MAKVIAGRTAEQWRDYVRRAVEVKRKAVAEAQEQMRRDGYCSSSMSLLP